MIGKDAGAEYIRVGGIEIRYQREPEDVEEYPEVSIHDRGKVTVTDVDGDVVPTSAVATTTKDNAGGYRQLFQGRMPSLGDL